MITVESLTKRFGTTLAVDGLSFEARPGRVTAFLGPNGAGKTTTFRVLLGLARATSGSALIEGRPYPELADPLRTVGAVLEGPTFHPGRTGRAHLRVLTCAAGLPAGRADDVLRLVELEEAGDVRVGRYSFGMRQRLSLAAALLGDPRALVLDEPANGLDPAGMRWLRGFLRGFAVGGRTVLVSSHVLSEVSQMADDVVVVDRGRLVELAPLSTLMGRTGAGVRVRSPDAVRLAALLEGRGFRVNRLDPDVVVVAQAATGAVGALAAEHGVVIHEMTSQLGTLEAAFLELTGSGTDRERGR